MARSQLIGIPPGDVEPMRPKILIYGGPGVGKTWVTLDFPSLYYIDTEGGAVRKEYQEKLRAGGGIYVGPKQGSLDFDVIINQVKALAHEQHGFRTIAFDSSSKLWNSALVDEQERLGSKDAFGAYKKVPTRKHSVLMSWVNRLDMNVIFTAHQKELWGMNDQKQREAIGFTYDGQDKLEYELDLVLRIGKVGLSRYAYVGKSRLPSFREGDVFDWSYREFAARYGQDVIEKDAAPLVLATKDQIDELQRLLAVVKMPDDWEGKVFKAAGVEGWVDMDTDKVENCLNMLKKRITP